MWVEVQWVLNYVPSYKILVRPTLSHKNVIFFWISTGPLAQIRLVRIIGPGGLLGRNSNRIQSECFWDIWDGCSQCKRCVGWNICRTECTVVALVQGVQYLGTKEFWRISGRKIDRGKIIPIESNKTCVSHVMCQSLPRTAFWSSFSEDDMSPFLLRSLKNILWGRLRSLRLFCSYKYLFIIHNFLVWGFISFPLFRVSHNFHVVFLSFP
jgi:hypothetical protein